MSSPAVSEGDVRPVVGVGLQVEVDGAVHHCLLYEVVAESAMHRT